MLDRASNDNCSLDFVLTSRRGSTFAFQPFRMDNWSINLVLPSVSFSLTFSLTVSQSFSFSFCELLSLILPTTLSPFLTPSLSLLPSLSYFLYPSPLSVLPIFRRSKIDLLWSLFGLRIRFRVHMPAEYSNINFTTWTLILRITEYSRSK